MKLEHILVAVVVPVLGVSLSACKQTFSSEGKAVLVAYESMQMNKFAKFKSTLQPGSEADKTYGTQAGMESLKTSLAAYPILFLDHSELLKESKADMDLTIFQTFKVSVGAKTDDTETAKYALPLDATVECVTYLHPDACGQPNPYYPNQPFPSDQYERDYWGRDGRPGPYNSGYLGVDQNVPPCELHWTDCKIGKIQLLK